jgi:hypothetical protein
MEATVMQITRNRVPSQRGAKKLLDQCSAKSVCVHYCATEQRQKFSKTSQLIKESFRQSFAHPFWKEVHWHNQVKVVGGKSQVRFGEASGTALWFFQRFVWWDTPIKEDRNALDSKGVSNSCSSGAALLRYCSIQLTSIELLRRDKFL